MKRLIAGLAAAAALAVQMPAEGFTHNPHERTEIAQVQMIKERVRERVRDRMREWYDERLAELTPEPVVAPTPAPTPDSTSAPSTSPTYGTSSTSWQLSEAEVAQYAREAGFPESVIPTMVVIAQRESNLCPTAVYGYGCAGTGHAVAGGPACGLWQIYTCPGPEALDPARNAALAYSKYQASGLAPWAATT